MAIKTGDIIETIDVLGMWALSTKVQVNNAVYALLNDAKAGTSGSPDYDNMFVDVFQDGSGVLDATGLRGTIDTGATTAYTSGITYRSFNAGGVFYNDGATSSQSTVTGAWPTVKTYTTEVAGNKLESITYQTKSQPGALNHGARVKITFLDTSTAFLGGGTNNNTVYATYGPFTLSAPDQLKTIDFAELQLNLYSGGGGDSMSARNIAFTSPDDYSDKIVQTVAQTIIANPDTHQLSGKYLIAGTGAISYDISFDGGSTYDVDQSLDTINVTTKTGSSMKVIINLDGTANPNGVTLTHYGVNLTYGGYVT